MIEDNFKQLVIRLESCKPSKMIFLLTEATKEAFGLSENQKTAMDNLITGAFKDGLKQGCEALMDETMVMLKEKVQEDEKQSK